MNDFLRQWRTFWMYFWEGEREWGETRWQAVVVTGLCLAMFGLLLVSPNQLQAALKAFFSERQLAVSDLVLLAVAWGWSLLRLGLPPLVAVVLALVFGTLYLQDIFEFPSFQEAYRFLEAAIFGRNHPLLTIRDGQKIVPAGEYNPLDKIGGPGWLDIRLGNVVLLERGAGPSSVLGAGWHFIRRFESIRTIMDLREVYRAKAEVKVITRDGIELTMRNVEATFRLDTGKQQQRTELNPYPFSVRAVRDSIYNRAVGNDGQLEDWAGRALNIIVGQITDWIALQRLDRLTAATAQDPRAAIRQLLAMPTARKALGRLGAELIWINIGHIDTPPAVDAQRAESWQSFWQGQNAVTEAHGQALRLQYEERGRAEGQAEMLRQIAQALADTTAADLPPQRLYELLLMRISHVLETLPKKSGSGDALSLLLGGPPPPRSLPPGT